MLIRTHGVRDARTLIYLPGLHGDWTLIGRFREALASRAFLVEITYPRTVTWSLEDYADGVITALEEQGIHQGWLLAESFSSQVAWRMLESGSFSVQGLILAGGFVRHPMLWGVRFAERVAGAISLGLLIKILFAYARLARRRSGRRSGELDEFIARRTALDQQAAKHRLHLLAASDPCVVARRTAIPVYGLSGLFDPIVPWWPVRSWLREYCPALRDFRIIRRCDHNVLSNAAKAAADQVASWMSAL